jgi:hypothetical protein
MRRIIVQAGRLGRSRSQMIIKKGAYQRRIRSTLNPLAATAAITWRNRLGDLALLHDHAKLPLDGFHLVLKPQFQLLKADFF